MIGFDASGTLAQTRAQVARIARDTAALVALGQEITDEDTAMPTPIATASSALSSPRVDTKSFGDSEG